MCRSGGAAGLRTWRSLRHARMTLCGVDFSTRVSNEFHESLQDSRFGRLCADDLRESMPIATLFDGKKEEKEEEDGGNELYTGGNRRGGGGSGLSVIGPGEGGDDDGEDHVAKMFKQAQQNAANGRGSRRPPRRRRRARGEKTRAGRARFVRVRVAYGGADALRSDS